MLPKDLAGLDTHREDIVRARYDVDDSVMNDRLTFAGILRFRSGTIQMRSPNRLQVRHVFTIDLRQRRVVLVEQVASILKPANGGRRRQFLVRECRTCSDGGIRADFHESRWVCRLLRMKYRPSGKQNDQSCKQ